MLRVFLIATMPAAVAFAAQAVDGHVVSAVTGIDIPGVVVNLVQAGQVAYSAITDSEGHFRIEGLAAGTYTANYTARGFWPIPNFFLDEDFERECGRCFLVERGGQPFQVVSGGEPVRLEVKMPPIGRISGRVLDYVGKPVPNASVQLHWGENWLCKTPTCIGLSRQTKTNEKGEYSVTDLDVPGAWLLFAIAPSSKPPESRDDQRLDWAQTFYPGVTDLQLAARVMVQIGGEISNLDIKLAATPVHRIRGVVLDLRGDPVPKTTVTLSKGIGAPSLIRNSRSDGTFEFESVAEGKWRISATADQVSPKLWTAQWVELKARDLEDLELRPVAPFAIQGKVVMEVPDGVVGPKPPTVIFAFNAGTVGVADKPGSAFLTGNPDARGDFQIQNAYPGPYQILPGMAPPQYYLDSIRIGGRDALGPGIEILNSAQMPTVTYKLGGGTVRGTVEKCTGGTVRLLPHNKAMWRQGFVLFAPCDSNDRYAITAVRPGEYYVLAIAGDSPTPWYATEWDDDALLNGASTVTVRAGENSAVDLRAIKQ